MGSFGYDNGDSCEEYNKDTSIPRNQSWEVTKEFHKKEWEETKKLIELAKEAGNVSIPLNHLDSVKRKVIMQIAEENGYRVSGWFGGSSSWNDNTAIICWLGYKTKEKNWNSMDTILKEKVKKEPTERDASWEEVKKVHSETKKKMKVEFDASVKRGKISDSFVCESKDVATIFGRMFREDGYFYEIKKPESMGDWIFWRQSTVELVIKVIDT
jgi:hypothetical protein